MKKITLGFACLLLGNILSVPETFLFYLGLLLGIFGFCLVVSGLYSDE